MKNKINTSDKSIENAGIPSDYRQAIAELIWNGFDAKASIVDIQFNTNELAHISTFTISDNGNGINLSELNKSFGAFLDSPKKQTYQRTSSTHGKRGKGRFSFTNFAAKAIWETRFLDENNKLGKEQGKTCVGFLNLLLDTDERENILTILGDVVKLTMEEREQLAHTLQTTSLNKVLRTIRMIQNRYLVVEMLKALVFDLKKFSTEREHIQKAIEENYWLFGEQFHLVSADDTFEKALSNYLYLLDGVKKEAYINSDERLRRLDIFMCRKRKIPDTQNLSDMLEENIIIELKRPTVTIGKEQFRQVEDYLDLIKNEEQFNSQMRHWKFFIVSNKIDDFIKDQYKSFQDKNRRFLVHMKEQFEIYAMTWDDIFQLFEIRHNYLLDKLNFDKNVIEEDFLAKGIKINKSGSNKIVSEVKTLEAI